MGAALGILLVPAPNHLQPVGFRAYQSNAALGVEVEAASYAQDRVAYHRVRLLVGSASQLEAVRPASGFGMFTGSSPQEPLDPPQPFRAI
jgi:hypothetical protein